MEFGILGPLEVRADGRAVALGGAKPRAVFAVLALHANQPVSAERIAVALWGEEAPPGAVKTVQVYVARLRKALDDPDVLATTPAGYRLRVRAGELDAELFERLVADGREALAAGRADDAAVVLREALGLWRGPPLADLAAAPFAPAEIARLEEQCLAAVEVRVDAELAAGCHAELVGELQQLASQHPWRERLHVQRMLALYRCGRQADALEAYRNAREVLVEQLGIEPGVELHDLQEAILAHDPAIDAPSAAGRFASHEQDAPTERGRRVVAELPSGTVTFLFSDVEGSTRLLTRLRDRYADVLGEHHRVLRAAFDDHDGREVQTEGDAFFVAFARASDAIAAAVAGQRALASHPWPEGVDVCVRMGVHTGEASLRHGGYVGLDVHRAARICSAGHGGQVLLSNATSELLEDLPPAVSLRDLGTYRLKDLDRPERLFQLVIAGLPEAFPPLTALSSDPGRQLPHPPTPTIGRDRELREIADRLRAEPVRLLTLTGPGGVGKTRLAIEVARRVAADFAHGAHFVALAAVADPCDFASAVARVLAVPAREGEPAAAAVQRHLAERQTLVVCDNFEHLLAGAPLVAELLAGCPQLTVLVTSRVPTKLAAERLYPVRPLDVPGEAEPTGEIGKCAAAAMFRDRVRARDPDFELDELTAPHVIAICRRVDGLPLALELASARVGILSPAELAARLGRALDVLVGGASDAPQRHRTVRATIDWSFDLLKAEERRAFAHMAVFAGGGTVTAAEKVTGASLDTLDSLLAHHLLVRRGDRLTMLETIREYASERLAEDPSGDEAQLRLAAWCLDVARRTTPSLGRTDHRSAVVALDAELPNALAALSWAIERRDSELALELVGEWAPYWWRLEHWLDGARWIDAALECADAAVGPARARALLYRARVTSRVEPGGTSGGQRLEALRESLKYYRAVDDAAGIAACLGHMAFDQAWIGRFEAADVLGREAMHFAERSQDEATIALVLTDTAVAAKEYESVSSRARRAMPYLQRVGTLRELTRLANVAGYAAIAARQYREALDWLEQGLEAGRRMQQQWTEFIIRGNQGLARLFLDELDAAEQDFSAALGVCRLAGAEQFADETLLGMAATASRQGDLDRAARLAGAAHSHESGGRSVDDETVWRRLHDEFLTPARERRGQEQWDSLERDGASLTLQEAIDLALVAPAARAGRG
jgi:predicted ATPase/DNA-binding SARP family transcriptional activator